MRRAVKNVMKSDIKWRKWVQEQLDLISKALKSYKKAYPFGAGIFPDSHLQYLGYCTKLQQRNNESDKEYAKRVYIGLKHILGANGIERAIAVLKNAK